MYNRAQFAIQRLTYLLLVAKRECAHFVDDLFECRHCDLGWFTCGFSLAFPANFPVAKTACYSVDRVRCRLCCLKSRHRVSLALIQPKHTSTIRGRVVSLNHSIFRFYYKLLKRLMLS